MSVQPAAPPYVGNEAARRFLLGSWQAGRLAHAYLFVGPRHVGRRTLALWLARLVNCGQVGNASTTAGPCDHCSVCRRIMHGNYSDLNIVEPEVDDVGEVKRGVVIEQIREVVEQRAPLRPYEGSTKVFVIRGADTMTPAAANAFLKTLEEPPADTIFVLTATDSSRLLPTIISRCQAVTLRPVPVRTLATALAAWEAWPDRNAESAELLARLSGGCPGAAVLAAQQPDYLTERQDWLDQVRGLVSADRHQRLAAIANMTSRSAARAAARPLAYLVARPAPAPQRQPGRDHALGSACHARHARRTPPAQRDRHVLAPDRGDARADRTERQRPAGLRGARPRYALRRRPGMTWIRAVFVTW